MDAAVDNPGKKLGDASGLINSDSYEALKFRSASWSASWKMDNVDSHSQSQAGSSAKHDTLAPAVLEVKSNRDVDLRRNKTRASSFSSYSEHTGNEDAYLARVGNRAKYTYMFCECGKDLIERRSAAQQSDSLRTIPGRRRRTLSQTLGNSDSATRKSVTWAENSSESTTTCIEHSEGGPLRRSHSLPGQICAPMLPSDATRISSPISGEALLSRTLPDSSMDIEDVVAEPSADIQGLMEATPRVLVTPKVLVNFDGLPTVESELSLGGSGASITKTALLAPQEDAQARKRADSKLSKSGLESDSDEETLLKQQQPEICERCLRRDCITIVPTVGYYTMASIRKHCSPDDCWILAHGNVYDVTRYLKKHPGGGMSILSRAGGVDCSADFDFHSKYSQRRLWIKFKIGKLAVCKNPPAKRNRRRTTYSMSHNSGGGQKGEENCCVQ